MKPYYQRAGWRWLPGMRDTTGRRVIDCYEWADCPPWMWLDGLRVEQDDGHDSACRQWADAIPDLTDGATQGVALAVLREVEASDVTVTLSPRNVAIAWTRPRRHGGTSVHSVTAPTLAEALAAALTALIPE